MATGLNQTYLYIKGFDQAKLSEGIFKFLPKHQPGYAPTAAECATTLINRLAADPRVPDLRYMAYMLATACHESREIKKFQVPKVGKGGKPVIDPKTKLQVVEEKRLWTIFNPIDELGQGKGLRYFESVKVLKTDDGALVTEKDGNQFKVSGKAKILKDTGMSEIGARGSKSGAPVHKKYTEADGVEHQYFGRGLVQITWWNGYAESGVAFGYGLELLFNPEKVKEYDVAYDIMVKGMTTGDGYANDRRCSMYFTDGKTDYVAARAMVNGSDKAVEIAALAQAFETLLLAARLP
jgi:hypothetical protein